MLILYFVKLYKLSFPKNKFNKALFVQSSLPDSKVTVKFTHQLNLLPRPRGPIKLSRVKITSGRPLMYSKERVGARMKSRETPILAQRSFEESLSRTTRNVYYWVIFYYAKYLTGNSMRATFTKKTSISNLSNSFHILNATARVVLDILKALVIIWVPADKRSSVERNELKPYWKSEEISHFPRWLANLFLTSFSKILEKQCGSLYPQTSKIWDLVPDQIKHCGSLTKFKHFIKSWSPSDCPCRLCKTYIAQVGFIWSNITMKLGD